MASEDRIRMPPSLDQAGTRTTRPTIVSLVGRVGTHRDGGIRTRDPLNPIQVRYRAALRPVLPQQAPLRRTERET